MFSLHERTSSLHGQQNCTSTFPKSNCKLPGQQVEKRSPVIDTWDRIFRLSEADHAHNVAGAQQKINLSEMSRAAQRTAEHASRRNSRVRSYSQPACSVTSALNEACFLYGRAHGVNTAGHYPFTYASDGPSFQADSSMEQLADLVCSVVYMVLKKVDIYGVFQRRDKEPHRPGRARTMSCRSSPDQDSGNGQISEWEDQRVVHRPKEHSTAKQTTSVMTPPLSAESNSLVSSNISSEPGTDSYSATNEWTPPASPPLDTPFKRTSQQYNSGPFQLGSNELLFRRYVLKILARTRICIPIVLIGLIYLKRLIRSDPHIKLNDGSEFRIFVVALLLASKNYDDQRISNLLFSKISGLKLYELNIMEVEFMSMINFDLIVSSKKYYQTVYRLQQLSDSIWIKKVNNRANNALGRLQ